MFEFPINDPHGLARDQIDHGGDRLHHDHGPHGRRVDYQRLFQRLFSDRPFSIDLRDIFFAGRASFDHVGISTIFSSR